MRAEADRGEELGGARAAATGLGSSQQRTSAKPAARSRASVSSAPAKFHGCGDALEVGGELGLARRRPRSPRARLGDVALAAALGDQAAARPQRRAQAPEEPLVVEDPVEDAFEKIDVHRLVELELEQVGDQQASSRGPSLSRAFSIIAAEPSTAITRPRGSRSSSSSR